MIQLEHNRAPRPRKENEVEAWYGVRGYTKWVMNVVFLDVLNDRGQPYPLMHRALGEPKACLPFSCVASILTGFS